MVPFCPAFSGRCFLWAGGLSVSLAAAAPVGFHYYGARAGDTTLTAEETAFGILGSSWASIRFSFEGNPSASSNTGTTEVEVNGAIYTLDWDTGSLFSGQINPATTPEEKVLALLRSRGRPGRPAGRGN